MAIYVQLRGELPPVFLPTTPEATVDEAVADAAMTWNRDPASHRLTFDGTPLLEAERTLASYGITWDSLVVLEAV